MTARIACICSSILVCLLCCESRLLGNTTHPLSLGIDNQQSPCAYNESFSSLPITIPRRELPELTTSPGYHVLSELEEYFSTTEGFTAEPHKRLWPLSTRDVVGFVLTILVLFIAAGGGIGGGGAIIPLYMLFLGFNTKIAVALGNITIVGGSLSNFVFNAPRRHSVFNRPLIDWDLILVMEPSTILGALVGGYINKVLPAWATTALLAALLTFITYKLLVRGIITWQNEGREKLSEDEQRQPLLENEHETGTEASDQTQSIQAPLKRRSSSHHEHHSPLAYTSSLSRQSTGRFRGSLPRLENGRQFLQAVAEPEEQPGVSEADENISSPLGGSPTSSQLLQSSKDVVSDEPQRTTREDAEGQLNRVGDGEESAQDSARDLDVEGGDDADAKQKKLDDRFAEKRQLPPIRLGVMVLLTAVVACTDYFKAKVPCGSWVYWLLVLLIIPIVAIVTAVARSYLLRKRKVRSEAGYVWREGDVDWNPVTTLTYPAICSAAGLVAGMFGVGGGIVKGPLMLELGVLPDVASATSATMIVFTSLSASIVFLSFGGIPLNYALTVFIIGIIFTMAGQIACYALMKALGRRSIIVFAMAALMVLSMIITYYEAIISIIAAAHSHEIWRFGRICK